MTMMMSLDMVVVVSVAIDMTPGQSLSSPLLAQPGHCLLSLLVASDVDIKEADESKLCQSKEHKDRADDDEDIKSGGIGHLRLGLPSKTNGHHSQCTGCAQTCPCRDFLTLHNLSLNNKMKIVLLVT